MKITVNNEMGREINHYKQYIDGGYENSDWYNWNTAENLASYPAPGFQDTAPGEWVEAEYSYQGYSRYSAKWMDISKDVFDRWNREHEPKIIWKTRQIWKAKAEGESVEQAFEKYPTLAAHIERMASTGQTGSGSEWSAFLRELNKALTKP